LSFGNNFYHDSLLKFQEKQKMKKIFISHSSLDSPIVGDLIDLIESIGINSSQIFCSSFEGYGFDLGEDFLERLKTLLNEEIIAFFILTPNFYKSPISLCEMGAIWIKSNKHIPVLVPPFDFKDIKGVFPVSQGMKINDKSKLNTLKETLENDFSLPSLRTSIWEKKRDKFLNDINSNIEGQLINFNKGTTAREFNAVGSPKTENELLRSEYLIDKITAIDSVLSKELQNYLIEIPSGEFVMGDENRGQFKVTISKPFLLAKYPVRQSLYQYVINNNPSHFIGSYLPVENISWLDAIKFCNELSQKVGLYELYSFDKNNTLVINESSSGFRLPYEFEWEYALNYNRKQIENNLDKFAWFHDNSEGHTHEVATKDPNSFGIFDLLGNVWEWCNDSFSDKIEFSKDSPPIFLDNTGSTRVLRGGSFAEFRTQFVSGFRKKAIQENKTKFWGFRIIWQNK